MARFLNKGVHATASPTANATGRATHSQPATNPNAGIDSDRSQRTCDGTPAESPSLATEVGVLLDRLRALLAECSLSTVEREQVLEDLADLQAEAAQETADRALRRDALERIGQRMATAEPAAAILTHLACILLPPDP